MSRCINQEKHRKTDGQIDRWAHTAERNKIQMKK